MSKKRTGIHLVEANLLLQLGIPPQRTANLRPYCGWAWFPSREGLFLEASKLELHSEYNVQWHTQPGIRYTKHGESIICELLFWHQNKMKLLEDVDFLRNWSPGTFV
ncbi:MAG: hypothetical protein F6K39_33200 [Okeania sp. SIO3B3]|nr:hypothetical protein [Okeania sp. SIO3B3]